MKFIATFVVAAIAAVGAIAAGANDEPADASFGDNRKCATWREANAVRLGMTRTKVKNIVDSNGKKTFDSNIGGYNFQQRDYRICGKSDLQVFKVQYVNGRVVQIDAFLFGRFR